MNPLNLTQRLYDYMLDVSVKEHPVLEKLRHKTAQLPLANMQISPEQAQFMQLLIHLTRATEVLEIGTFTGYSALAMALALPEQGHLITCDINEAWTNIAQAFWKEANLSSHIELRLSPALDTLETLVQLRPKSFDFIFIDADKSNYVNYYELAMQLIRTHGLIVVDNVLWGGKVVHEASVDSQTQGIRRFNEHIKQDKRVYSSLLPIRDGIFLITPKSINHEHGVVQ